MELEEVLHNIRAVPLENRAHLQQGVMSYFPIIVDLLSRCEDELSAFWTYYIEPSER